MGTYQQWRTAVDKSGPRRVTWVCGDQPVLIEEIVDTTRDRLKVDSVDYVSLHAGESADPVIWAAAQQVAFDPAANRLILVRDAHRITDFGPLKGFLAASRMLPRNHLLLVSAEAELATTAPTSRTLAPHLEAIKGRGHLVRASRPNDGDLLAWIRRRGPTLDQHTARFLMTRVDGDLAIIAGVCAKLAAFPDIRPGQVSIQALCDEYTTATFTDHLLADRKPQAIATIPGLGDTDTLQMFAALDRRLDALETLWHAARDTAGPPHGIHPYLAHALAPITAFYDPARCARARSLLAVIEIAFRSGARTGTLEALVTLW